jgi:hypothetical protein
MAWAYFDTSEEPIAIPYVLTTSGQLAPAPPPRRTIIRHEIVDKVLPVMRQVSRVASR